jgi:hypothetical protein
MGQIAIYIYIKERDANLSVFNGKDMNCLIVNIFKPKPIFCIKFI